MIKLTTEQKALLIQKLISSAEEDDPFETENDVLYVKFTKLMIKNKAFSDSAYAVLFFNDKEVYTIDLNGGQVCKDETIALTGIEGRLQVTLITE